MKAELYHETKTKSQANGRLFLSLFLLRKSSRFCQEFSYKPVGLCTGVPSSRLRGVRIADAHCWATATVSRPTRANQAAVRRLRAG